MAVAKKKNRRPYIDPKDRWALNRRALTTPDLIETATSEGPRSGTGAVLEESPLTKTTPNSWKQPDHSAEDQLQTSRTFKGALY